MNRSAEDDLALLRESADRAVALLRGSGTDLRVQRSYALSAAANHRFKLACVHAPGEDVRTELLTQADALVGESVAAVANATYLSAGGGGSGGVPSLALGIAMLVGGVVATVRSHDLAAIDGPDGACDLSLSLSLSLSLALSPLVILFYFFNGQSSLGSTERLKAFTMSN